MKFLFSRMFLATLFTFVFTVSLQAQPLLKNEAKINDIISQMTLEEKVEMLHGKNMFSSAGVERLGIADLEYADGPFGIREEMEPHSWNSLHLTTDSATFFPTGSALAATWSPEMAYAYGRGMGIEARLRGKDMVLGPAMNIQRIPTGGRTYEYLSEDPLLTGFLAVAYTKGCQDTGTAVCLKHFALNNQENYRGFVDVRVSPRAMNEIYLRPFEMAVREGDACGVMSAYNKVDGKWCSDNEMLLTDVLRKRWGFPGIVISDWGGVHATSAVAAGMNVEMPGNRFMGKALLDSVKAGVISEAVIDQRVRELLRVRLLVKPVPAEKANAEMTAKPEQLKTAYEVAKRSIVLLKNDGVLPLNLKRVKKIAVIGDNARCKQALGGVGAGVKTLREVTPLEGIREAIGNGAEVVWAQGYPSYGAQQRFKRVSPQMAPDRKLLAEAVKIARKADVVIFVAGDNREIETEGSDRVSIKMPQGQNEVAKALAAANKNMVTVVVAGGPLELQTVRDASKALLISWFNGSEGGTALGDVLIGKVSPSGKLPFTFPIKLEDSPAYATGSYPQQLKESDRQGDIFVGLVNREKNDRSQELIAPYAEELLVGYRWFTTKQLPVAYPFGYGLSYANFEYSNLSAIPNAEGIRVEFDLKNNSSFDAEEVAQVYISRKQSALERPVLELKGFQRVALGKGEQKRVSILLRRNDMKDWNAAIDNWQLEAGEVDVRVGSSSADLRLTQTCTIN
ncbi:MAG: glycoside hydrolase family 3 C-terminal domain-containing protein [Prevotella sp.]|nr:glycoside hydrolase family 3 C-terminal domain-containing protein [Prevotella sp.]